MVKAAGLTSYPFRTVNIEANEGLLALLASVKPNHSVVDTILTIPSPPSDDSVLAAPPFQILALKQWVRIYPKSLVESVTAILVEGKKQLDADRHSTHRSLTELDLGSGQQDVTGAQIVAQLDNILANLVLWRSIIARVGVKDPVLSNEGVRQALQPLLSDERFFSRHQRLLLALAARSNPTILSS